MAKSVAAPRKSTLSEAKSAGGSQYLSRAVSKSLKVLELLQSARSPMSLKEIARRIQLSKTSTFRLLRTLEAAGCLVAVGAGEYRLAPGIYSVVPTLGSIDPSTGLPVKSPWTCSTVGSLAQYAASEATLSPCRSSIVGVPADE